ncbi:hypothetical protein [Ornithinimicrobium avium]|uniref:Uncharacterized protein n=1 Tax=Ornithinimicrobium avium TaxID=2283195 RepID=A0A345NKK1_9MICO|nr:hypothetical protein [Ornithinimicrobium avium]AXH95559.1 hypothetical protein DV701_04970 [Ornithinimicrobium avium]
MTKSPVLLTLQLSALVTAGLALLQTVLGFVIVSGSWVSWHGDVGYLTFVVSLVAAVAAFLWMRRSGNKGIFMHAAGMAVLFLVQVGLAEMELKWVHVVLGVLLLLGSAALATLAYRRPGALPEPVSPDRLA